MPVALTIAGSDPSGGAGIQADLKTFHQHGVYGTSALTLITVQNTTRVSAVEVLEPGLVVDQIHAVLDDVPPRAAKTGALGNAAVVEAVAAMAAEFSFPLVVDPVMISKHGASLMDESARGSLEKLIAHAALVTPNTQEAAVLCGRPVDSVEQAHEAAKEIADRFGARAVLVKGGHLPGAPVDVLYTTERWHEFDADRASPRDLVHTHDRWQVFEGERVDTTQTHGTGCTLSAAIAARLALGADLVTAIAGAKLWLSEALRTAPGLGRGVGPVNHFAAISPVWQPAKTRDAKD